MVIIMVRIVSHHTDNEPYPKIIIWYHLTQRAFERSELNFWGPMLS